jgi:hypothetical protein
MNAFPSQLDARWLKSEHPGQNTGSIFFCCFFLSAQKKTTAQCLSLGAGVHGDKAGSAACDIIIFSLSL